MLMLKCVYYYHLVPKGVPIGVKAVYFNATAAIVEWIPVNDTRDVMKGVLIGYRVCTGYHIESAIPVGTDTSYLRLKELTVTYLRI